MNYSLTGVSVALGSLLIFGAFIVFTHQPVSPSDTKTWSSGSLIGFNERTQVQEQPTQHVTQSNVALPSLHTADPEPIVNSSKSETNNEVVHSTVTFTSQISDAWSLIPGLIATTDSPQPQHSAFQISLHRYGNEAGSILETLDGEYGTRQVPIMRDFYADRYNDTKREAVIKLAHALTEAGDSLANISDVPDAMTSYNSNLATGYHALGTTLAQIPLAKSDADLLKAIETYDKSADSFTTSYVALAEYFSVASVTFDQSESGRMFVFTGQKGL